MNQAEKPVDYLVIGSGIAGLVFAALMAKSGRKVVVLEAHEHPGGYGHTFQMGESARFNAQLHYVWNCGEGQTVYKVLEYLGLEKEVTFEELDPNGFDRMIIPGHEVKIPASSNELGRRLTDICPDHGPAIRKFLETVERTATGLDCLAGPLSMKNLSVNGIATLKTLTYMNCTLQDVFDKFALPLPAQSLLASQWPDFLLPPEKLSFYAWVMLFTGYQRGAYYPTRHFEYAIDALVDSIRASDGEVLMQHQVTEFVMEKNSVSGVHATDLTTFKTRKFFAQTTVCNMDPKLAANMIGMENFSRSIQKKLDYEYSPSNFMLYCTVKDLDLKKHGFGKWNTFHCGHEDINKSFNTMYYDHDYSNPSFAITTPGLMTDDCSDRPEGQQIVEMVCVADYSYFAALLAQDKRAYRKKKKEIVDSLLDVMEENYVPDFRKYLTFKTGGTPTTNERFCLSPMGNSYGSDMTPKNIGPSRLKADTSIDNFYFCNASSGFAGFAGTFWTGAALFQKLSREKVL